MTEQAKPSEKKIVISKNGPYEVHGDIPLVRKTAVVSAAGEPLTWRKDETLVPDEEPYYLCRCGCSGHKPFCDGSHRRVGFDGTETADPRPTASRQLVVPGQGPLVVKRDVSLCSEAGFCANRLATLDSLLADAADPCTLTLVLSMIERCPSGSYTYALQAGEADMEPDLGEQIAVTTELTSTGPIMGPLWVTGGIPIVRADGQPVEVRNRVTLCRCGLSRNKPFCDGQHRAQHVTEERSGT